MSAFFLSRDESHGSRVMGQESRVKSRGSRVKGQSRESDPSDLSDRSDLVFKVGSAKPDVAAKLVLLD